MHTSDSETVTFVHNGDYSGDLHIVGSPENVEIDSFGGRETVTFKLPFKEVRNFILEYLRDQEIANLQNMSYDEYAEYLT